MELAVRVGGRRCGEITDKPAQPDGGYIPVSGADVKKAISKPPDSGEIDSDFIRRILKESFPRLRKPVVKNLAWITMAFINVLEGLRSGNGKLTLASIARGLPFQGKFKMLYQKVSRFLKNKFLDPGCLTEGLFTMLMGEGARGMLPVIVDQTTVAGVLAILAGVAFSGRVFPVGIFTYTNKDIEDRPDREKSRNYIETLFMLRMLEACPVDLVLLFVLDRGYARVSLMRELLATSGVLFLTTASGYGCASVTI